MQVGDVLQWLGIVGCAAGLAYLSVRERRMRKALGLAQVRLSLLNRATQKLRADLIEDQESGQKETVRMTAAELDEISERARRSKPP